MKVANGSDQTGSPHPCLLMRQPPSSLQISIPPNSRIASFHRSFPIDVNSPSSISEMLWLLLFLPVLASAQQVNVTIFTESQCPFCTRLLREQIWPFYVGKPGVMNLQVGRRTKREPQLVQIIPFGKGDCTYDYNRNFHCTCMHGATECDLNRLQNCAISVSPLLIPRQQCLQYFPRRHLGLVTCIQGLKDLREAFSRCLARLSARTQRFLPQIVGYFHFRKLIECATTQTGELLNYYSMVNTHRAGVRVGGAVLLL